MEPTDQNRAAWDEVHRRRAEALAGRLGIPAEVQRFLPDLKDRHVLHLQCATGEQTAELVERGALVTGVDRWAEALAVAREHAPGAALVQADVHALPLELRRSRFDLVFTGGGVLEQLHDLDAWAAGIHSALRPGGHLLLYDAHPVLACLDAALRWREDYFADEPDGEDDVRFWRLGQVVTAVAQAGLEVRRVEEQPSPADWRVQDPRVPGAFVLVATRRV